MTEARYSIKAGRFTFDAATKKVKVSRDKGQLSIYTNEEAETHVSWVDSTTKVEELDLIVFPFDAVFEKVETQNNTYLLRFESSDDKYFFYLQEKINPQEFVKRVNQQIAYEQQEEAMEVEKQEEKMEIQKQDSKMEAEKPEEKMQAQKPASAKVQQAQKVFNEDFIHRLQRSLMAANRPPEGGITHLSKIITEEAVGFLLSSTSQEEKTAFLEFLPAEQRNIKDLASNVQSPQFQQAVDVLSDALNSENAIPLFMELGLDQKYLKSHFGVHAFVKAMEEWGVKQEEKKEEKKE